MTPVKFYDAWPVPITTNAARIPSVTLPQIAAMTDPKDKVLIFDGDFQNISIKKFKKIVKSAELIGITLTTPRMSLSAEVNIRIIKKINPDAVIVMGGHQPSFHAARWCEIGADIIVRREGEFTFKELLYAIKNNLSLKNIAGITYKKENKIFENPDREFCNDLNSLPFPRWDLVNLDHYDYFFDIKGKTASIETSRGCPHNCSFCIISEMWKQKIRFKSADRVIEEIKRLGELGVRKIFFVDDNFGMDPELAIEIGKKIKELPYKINFSALMRADSIHKRPEMIKICSEAGLKFVLLGLETPNTKVLKKINKRTELTIKEYISVYQLLKKHDILTLGYYMFGYPDQPASDLDLIIKYGTNITCDILMLATFDPFYGTKGYDIIKEKYSGLKDMFYHYQLFYSYPEQEKVFKERVFKNISTFLGNGSLTALFSKRPNKRRFYRYFYWVILKNLFSLSFERIRDFIILKLPFDLNKRQEMLRSCYCSDKAIDKILQNNNKIISPIR